MNEPNRDVIAEKISKIPDTLFTAVKEEISGIEWSKLPHDTRSEKNSFKTSTALHLRVHKTEANRKYSLEELCEIVSCVDTPERYLFSAVNKLVEWCFKSTNSTELGRVMVVKLAPKGTISKHVDPGSYFNYYKRYHVPIETNQNVLFYNDHSSFHMEESHLYRLYNLSPHGVRNDSTRPRIHLIMDFS